MRTPNYFHKIEYEIPSQKGSKILRAVTVAYMINMRTGKLTYGAAGVFMTTSIWLSVVQGQAGKVGLRQQLERAAQSSEAPVQPKAGPADQKAPSESQPIQGSEKK